jgi:predicted outer membrane repeat protein
MKHFYILFSLILATSFSQLNADILYVKPGATSTAWQNQTNVYSDLQTALADAVAGDEVWVAAGIFKPTNDGDRDISFELQDGVHYYGGFVGDETELSLRDWRENETILSGDIGVEGDNTDNSRQVVTLNEAADVSTEYRTFFDGFIVEDGHGARGGGFYIGDGDPIVRNCWFRENLVSNRGSAIYSGSSDVVEYGNVIFSGNSSKESATVYTYRKGLFYNCLWFNNQADIYSVVHTGTSTTSMYNSLAVNNTNYSGGEVIHRWINLYNTKEYGKGYSSQLLFVDVANYDFRLVEGSEVVDAGDNSNLPDWLSLDFYGNGRIQNDNVDLGPIEGSWQTPRPISPENRSIIEFGISEVEISWGWGGAEPDGVVNYVLEYEIDGGDVLSVSNGLNTSLNLSSLDEGSQVLWKVRAELQSGDFLSAPHQLFVCERSHHLYVTPDGIGNGTSWIDAMSLRDVIDASVYGDSVWVAAGTYKPTDDANRNNSFLFKDGVVLLGGFNGTESSVEERDWLQNQTILSGDIGEEGLSTDNSYNVVTIYEDEFGNGTKDLILDGFVIEDGYNSLNNPGGGGLLLYGAASPLIRNVWFRDNYTNYSGGAVYGGYNSTARFGNVLFTDNSTGYFGGAVYSDGNLEFYNCVWYGNFAGDTGGSVYGEAIIKNSVSWNNYSGSYVDDFTFSAGVTNSIYKTSDFGGNVISENPCLWLLKKMISGYPGEVRELM